MLKDFIFNQKKTYGKYKIQSTRNPIENVVRFRRIKETTK